MTTELSNTEQFVDAVMYAISGIRDNPLHVAQTRKAIANFIDKVVRKAERQKDTREWSTDLIKLGVAAALAHSQYDSTSDFMFQHNQAYGSAEWSEAKKTIEQAAALIPLGELRGNEPARRALAVKLAREDAMDFMRKDKVLLAEFEKARKILQR